MGMPPANSRTLALGDLGTMSHEELTEVAEASLEKNIAQQNKIDRLIEESFGEAFPLEEMAASVAGATSAGLVMGDIQRRIDAGEEGYTEESLKLGKMVDYDLAMSVTAAIGSVIAHKSGATKERRAPGTGRGTLRFAKILRGFATGAASGAAYRLAYTAAVEPDEQQPDTDEEDDQAAV